MNKTAETIKAEVVRSVQKALEPLLGEPTTPENIEIARCRATWILQELEAKGFVRDIKIDLRVDENDPTLIHVSFVPKVPIQFATLSQNRREIASWYNGATGEMESYSIGDDDERRE